MMLRLSLLSVLADGDCDGHCDGDGSHKNACTEKGTAPFDKKSPQESENRTPNPWGQNRTRRRAQRRGLHRSIRNHLRSSKIAVPTPGRKAITDRFKR